MRVTNWIRPLTARLTRRTPQACGRFRPRLEFLEGRDLPSFGAGGIAVTDVAVNGFKAIHSIVVQPADGKILAASSGGLVRYNSGGTLDGSFNPGGALPGVIALTNPNFSFNSIALQPDGKIVAAGQAYNGKDWDFLMERFLPGGTLDTTFGTGGVVTTAFKGKSNDTVAAVTLQSDGKIVVAGQVGGIWTVARYTPQGQLDTAFNRTGYITTSFSNNPNGGGEPTSVAIDSNGRVVAAGQVVPAGANRYDFAVTRYTTTGTLDTSFGGTGKVLVDFGGGDRADSLAIQPDGKIVLGGEGGPDHFSLARLNPNGSLDAGFGQGGKLQLLFTDNFDNSRRNLDVALQPDGKIVAAGGPYGAAFVMRLTPNGQLDTTFNTMGWRCFFYQTPTVGEDRTYAIGLQPDGKVLVGGSTSDGTTQAFALARFNPDGSFDGSQPATTLGSFTAGPATVPSGGTTTLTVGGITAPSNGATIVTMSFFYRDAAGNERLLGYGTPNADGTWSLTLTVNLAPGSYTLFAFAMDSFNRFSDPLSLTLTVV